MGTQGDCPGVHEHMGPMIIYVCTIIPPSKAIVNAGSNITYRPLIEAVNWDNVDIVCVTLLFEQWIIFKNLQFILLFLNI